MSGIPKPKAHGKKKKEKKSVLKKGLKGKEKKEKKSKSSKKSSEKKAAAAEERANAAGANAAGGAPSRSHKEESQELIAKKPKNLVVGEVYQLGEEIGKGGFATVYKGLNVTNGDFVAVKEFTLHNIDEDQLKNIRMEINLMKMLDHGNIVKYIDEFETKEYFYIVLEFVENGSLQGVVKKFGKLSEGVVALYTSQVLEGLNYLHEQGVIHRDIKGANLLTTKDGVVKLADFGVSTSLGEGAKSDSVVGTPYWMAPEIIEMAGPSTASDIWSVGCTVIELLTGSPPYFDLAPMPALFRIVQDDYPPLPDAISSATKDFLLECFQKDPHLRVSAAKLLKHPFIQGARAKHGNDTSGAITSRGTNVIQPDANIDLDDAMAATSEGAMRSKQIDKVKMNMLGMGGSARKKGRKRGSSNTQVSAAAAAAKKEALSRFKEEEEDEEDWGDWDDDADGGGAGGGGAGGVGGMGAMGGALRSVGHNVNFIKPSDIGGSNKRFSDVLRGATKDQLSRFKEGGEDDYDDLLGGPDPFEMDEDELDGFDDAPQIDFTKKLKAKMKNTWEDAGSSGGGKESAVDPFADVVDFAEDARTDNFGQQSKQIRKLIDQLQPDAPPDKVMDTCRQLISIFEDNPALKRDLIAYHGAIPIMEMLEVSNPSVLHSVLQLVNRVIQDNEAFQEYLSLVGLIPSIIMFSGPDSPKSVRREAALFFRQMCHTSYVTLQMFIACRGLNVLTGFLEPNYREYKELALIGVEGITEIFEMQGPTPKNDFCRLFIKSDVLERLAFTLHNLIQDKEFPAGTDYVDKICTIFVWFSQGDEVVKRHMSSADVLQGVMRALHLVPPACMVKLLKCIKNLSMTPPTLEPLQRAGAIPKLISFLEAREGPMVNEMHNQVLGSLFNLCRLNHTRQEIAATSGIIPHLQHFIGINSTLKEFALQIYCDLAHASKRSRMELWRYEGVEFYLDILKLNNWSVNALEALAACFADEPRKTEAILAKAINVRKLIHIFNSTNNEFENSLEPFLKILQCSEKLTQALGKSTFVPKLVQNLQHPKAFVKKNLLRIFTALLEQHENPTQLIDRFHLYPLIVRLAENDASALVRGVANALLGRFCANREDS